MIEYLDLFIEMSRRGWSLLFGSILAGMGFYFGVYTAASILPWRISTTKTFTINNKEHREN